MCAVAPVLLGGHFRGRGLCIGVQWVRAMVRRVMVSVWWVSGCMLCMSGGKVGGANLYYLMLVHVADTGSYSLENIM